MQSYEVKVTASVVVKAPNEAMAGVLAVEELRRAWDGEEPKTDAPTLLNVEASSKNIKPRGPAPAAG